MKKSFAKGKDGAEDHAVSNGNAAADSPRKRLQIQVKRRHVTVTRAPTGTRG